MAEGKASATIPPIEPPAQAAAAPVEVVEEVDFTPEHDELLVTADALAGVAERMRAKGDASGADRAAQAAQRIREVVAGRALAANEAANYARANELREIETEE